AAGDAGGGERGVQGLREWLGRRRRAVAAAGGTRDRRTADDEGEDGDDEDRKRAGREGAEISHSPSVVPADSERSLRRGSSIVKLAPSAYARPPWRSAIARTIGSPRPDPFPLLRPRQKRRNACSASYGWSPGPSSLTVTSAWPSFPPTVTVIRPSAGPYLRAFWTRFSTARSSAARSPRTLMSRSTTARTPSRAASSVTSSATSTTSCGGSAPDSSRESASRSSASCASRSASR